MTDDLKERLKVVACCDTDSTMRHFAYAFMEQDPDGDYVTYAAAKARITDLEARLAAAEAEQAAQPVAHVDGRSYRKKPVVVKAVQWTGENLREVIAFTDGPPETKSHHAGMMWEQYEDLVRKNGLKIYTLEGKMDASPGDWIIKGVKGEFYPCKPDIFAATYDPANQPTAPVAPAEGLSNRRAYQVGYAVGQAAAEADVNRLREGEARLSLLLNETALARDAAEAENIRLKRQVETLKTGWGIADRDRIKAEAGEDALAEALRITRERLMDAVHSEFDGVWSAEDFNEQEAEAAAALAAYEARRG